MATLTINPGDKPTAAQFNSYMTHTGGAWDTWTPVVTQSGSVAVTVTEATYSRSGRMITFTAALTVTGSGSAANDVTISLPITAKTGYLLNGSVLGIGRIFDSSAVASYGGYVTITSTTTIKLVSLVAPGFLGTITFTAGLAVNDLVLLSGTYEAATG